MEDGKMFIDENGNELSLDEVFSEAERIHSNILANDDEWSKKIIIHNHAVISAFSIGIQQSYPWYENYRCPENYEYVLNKMCELLIDELKKFQVCSECVNISLLKLKGVYYRLAMSIPEYVAWNNIGSCDNVTISYMTEPPKNAGFIDLTVPPHNACIFLRNEKRNNDRFDKEFEEKYGSGSLFNGES